MTPHTKEWYLSNKGKEVRVGRCKAVVTEHRTESRGGSWERGFRFYRTLWGMLKRLPARSRRHEYSLDGGRTWHASPRLAMKSKGKVKLDSSNHGEFAFEAIQKINREWEPGFTWRR